MFLVSEVDVMNLEIDLNEVGFWRLHVGDLILSSVWLLRIRRKEKFQS